MVEIITRFVDFFYIKPLRFIPINTFRYAAVGGLNLGVNLLVYWMCFHFVLHKDDVDFGVVVISAHILAFFIAFVLTVFSGFWLTRNIAFASAERRGAEQLLKYSQVVTTNFLINYFGLKLLVNVLGFYPSLSYAGLQIVTVSFSYLMQRFYTFRKRRNGNTSNQ